MRSRIPSVGDRAVKSRARPRRILAWRGSRASQVEGRIKRRPGDCFGFPAGTGLAHQLVNRGDATVSYLEIGDRTPDESVEYPHDDLAFASVADGAMVLVHKDGRPY